ncbi:hypothetical protein SynBIOSE41_03973 [Synechococcus sp. BIOS-E4-1]|nr:hypothetical protein SynBIOSE41_03973 [Synechococcus sp. BIOS-E4-1]
MGVRFIGLPAPPGAGFLLTRRDDDFPHSGWVGQVPLAGGDDLAAEGSVLRFRRGLQLTEQLRG